MRPYHQKRSTTCDTVKHLVRVVRISGVEGLEGPARRTGIWREPVISMGYRGKSY